MIVAYPLVDTFILSFTNASLRKTTNWVGWANYEKIFNADLRRGHHPHLRVDLLLGGHQDDHRHLRRRRMLNAAVPGRALFRILTMPPWIVPMAIGIFMWGWMYNGQFGMISGLLQRFGIVDGPVAFLALRRRRPSGRRSSPTSGSACRW